MREQTRALSGNFLVPPPADSILSEENEEPFYRAGLGEGMPLSPPRPLPYEGISKTQIAELDMRNCVRAIPVPRQPIYLRAISWTAIRSLTSIYRRIYLCIFMPSVPPYGPHSISFNLAVRINLDFAGASART